MSSAFAVTLDSWIFVVFTLRCEVIEVKDKPTYPVGKIFVDAFGNKPTYEDKGIRRRALLAIGKVDYAFSEDLVPPSTLYSEQKTDVILIFFTISLPVP